MFRLEDFNPDCYLDPEDLDEEITVIQSLLEYCKCKKQEMVFRKIGNINAAVRLNRECDRIYDGLPQSVKW